MLDFLLGNDLLSAVLAFAIVFIPAVLIHELGHFLAAKAVGITVLEFGIGFPPRVAKLFTWRETEFTLNMIPMGGFVRPLGEDMIRPISEEAVERDRQELLAARVDGATQQATSSDLTSEERYLTEREELISRGYANVMAVHEAKPLPRIFFMAAGAVANFIFAYAVFVFVGLVGLPQEVGVRVGFAEVPEQSALAELGFINGDLIERIEGNYFESADDLFARLDSHIGEQVILQIRRTSTTPSEVFNMDVVPTQELLDLFRSVEHYVLVTSVEADSPGQMAGLQQGDLITSFNQQSLVAAANPAESLVLLTDRFAGTEVTLGILRDGESTTVSVVPRVDPPVGSGKIGIGISPQFISPDGAFGYVEGRQFDAIPQPLGPSIDYANERVGAIFRMIAEFPARILGGNTEPEERRVVSVVGISQIGGAILQDSIEESEVTPVMEYVALISIALGFTNLLPIPALDGGRILFVVLELVRGKPIPPEREGLVHLVGVIFILSLGVFVIINDLINPLTEVIR